MNHTPSQINNSITSHRLSQAVYISVLSSNLEGRIVFHPCREALCLLLVITIFRINPFSDHGVGWEWTEGHMAWEEGVQRLVAMARNGVRRGGAQPASASAAAPVPSGLLVNNNIIFSWWSELRVCTIKVKHAHITPSLRRIFFFVAIFWPILVITFCMSSSLRSSSICRFTSAFA